MGKAGKWGAGWKSQTSYHGHEAWPEYYGSHSDYYGRPHKWTAEPSGSAFPTFEMMTVGRAKGDSQDPHAPAAEGPGGNGDFVKHVQKLVNNVRRAEQKMRKQVAEQQQTDEKWAQFQKELKTAFMKERTKYKDRMDRLLKEKEEARAAQENAVEELYKMLADPQAYIQAPTDTEPAQDAQPGRLAPADGEARGGCRHGAGWGIQGAGDEGPSPAANVGDSPQKGGQSTSDDTASHGREPTRSGRGRPMRSATPTSTPRAGTR